MQVGVLEASAEEKEAEQQQRQKEVQQQQQQAGGKDGRTRKGLEEEERRSTKKKKEKQETHHYSFSSSSSEGRNSRRRVVVDTLVLSEFSFLKERLVAIGYVFQYDYHSCISLQLHRMSLTVWASPFAFSAGVTEKRRDKYASGESFSFYLLPLGVCETVSLYCSIAARQRFVYLNTHSVILYIYICIYLYIYVYIWIYGCMYTYVQREKGLLL